MKITVLKPQYDYAVNYKLILAKSFDFNYYKHIGN